MEIKQNLVCLVQFPILGLRSDGEPFEYLIEAINNNSIHIAVYDWFVSRTVLNIGEQVDLLIPNLLNESSQNSSDLGKVTNITPSSTKQVVEHKIMYESAFKKNGLEINVLKLFCNEKTLSISLHELLLQYIKDTKLLKSGVRIYFKHLNAYFSRISPFNPKEYAAINKAVFKDIEMHIKQNEKKLYELHELLEKKLMRSEDIAVLIDLEQLREMIESEISLSLLSHIFSEDKIPSQMAISMDIHSKHPCIAYLIGIKTLERRLYLNYNSIVAIYSQSLLT